MEIEDLELLEPWERVKDGRGLEAELVRELPPGHRLFGRTMRAVARRIDQDDVLFVAEAAQAGGGPFRQGQREYAIVHLTWRREADPRWPSTHLLSSLAAFVAEMQDDHDDYVGPDPRSFAMEFRAPLDFAGLRARLSEDARGAWAERDDGDGAHLWRSDGTTEVRIFPKDEARAFVVEAYQRADEDGWYARTRPLVRALLRALGATNVQGTLPDHE